MDIEQLAPQLGVAGLLILAIYRLGRLGLKYWSTDTQARTKEMSQGFANVMLKLDAHDRADQEAHAEITDRVSRFEGQLVEIRRHQESRHPSSTIPHQVRKDKT